MIHWWEKLYYLPSLPVWRHNGYHFIHIPLYLQWKTNKMNLYRKKKEINSEQPLRSEILQQIHLFWTLFFVNSHYLYLCSHVTRIITFNNYSEKYRLKKVTGSQKNKEPKHDWEKWGLTENHTKADIFQYGKKNKSIQSSLTMLRFLRKKKNGMA